MKVATCSCSHPLSRLKKGLYCRYIYMYISGYLNELPAYLFECPPRVFTWVRQRNFWLVCSERCKLRRLEVEYILCNL